MKRIKGFTLIELLIVVAIIAILAAIAVPNFLEAQIRSKVSRVKADQRSLATALESYFIDNNAYPAWAAEVLPAGTPNMTINVNYSISSVPDVSVRNMRSFAIAQQSTADYTAPMFSVTTPIAYITSYPQDPFMTTRGATFGYYCDPSFLGWILYSVGPDTDQTEGGDVDREGVVESLYVPFITQPSTTMIALGTTDSAAYPTDWDAYLNAGTVPVWENSFTYDPTNGTTSDGDVYRTKQ
jgi:prepilin-type N-terminal cleavage/methylation domain-containing protein